MIILALLGRKLGLTSASEIFFPLNFSKEKNVASLKSSKSKSNEKWKKKSTKRGKTKLGSTKLG